MKEFRELVRKLVRRDEGATMIEYALMAGIVSIASLAALQVLGPGLLALYQLVAAAVQAAAA